MANIPNIKTYIIAHGYGDDFAIDGVCSDRDTARRLCAVYNDSVGKKGLCYVERRVLTVNNYPANPDAEGDVVFKVAVQFGLDRSRKVGNGKVLYDQTEGKCYFTSKKTQPSVSQDGSKWTVEFFVETGTAAELIEQAREILTQHLLSD